MGQKSENPFIREYKIECVSSKGTAYSIFLFEAMLKEEMKDYLGYESNECRGKYEYGSAVRKIMCTTNAVESIHSIF